VRILLLGKNGQLGHELSQSLKSLGELILLGREQLNLEDVEQVQKTILSIAPDLIINASAYTAVDLAESEPEKALLINASAVKELATAAKKLDIPLIHYSTDYVFNGSKQTPWVESDQTYPLNVYGKTKLAGETAITDVGPKHLILRISWVYGSYGKNFLNTMLSLSSREYLSVVDDQYGAPTWTRDIANATAETLNQATEQPDFWQKNSGLFHLSAGGKASWFEFAKEIFSIYAEQGKSVPTLKAITSDDYPTAAQRPQYSCLNNDKLNDIFGIKLPHWRESLRKVLATDNSEAGVCHDKRNV
jgi:dTDP-4-dehydrorhamnose reductase